MTDTATGRKFITNFTTFFKEPRDIYVQNVSSKQVSMQFELGGGSVESFLVPAVKDPINLTQHIPFEAVKNSVDLRKMLTRSPPILVVLDEPEYKAYYESKAKRMGLVDKKGKPQVERAIEDAEARASAIRNRMPLPDAPAPAPIHAVSKKDPNGVTGNEEASAETKVMAEDVVRGKVLHLVNQVGNPALKDNERMPAGEFLNEIENVSDLTIDELEHIRAHGYYKSVKKWAQTKIRETAPTE